jgi:dihydropyrimidinase
MTLSRGELLYCDGQVTSKPGRGRFLPCERPFANQRVVTSSQATA